MLRTTQPILFGLLILGAACSGASETASNTVAEIATATEATTPATTAAAQQPDDVPMTVGTEPQTSESADVITAVTVTSAPHSPLAALVDVQTSIAAQVQVTATSGDRVVATPFTAASLDHHEIPLVGLAADREWQVEVVAFVDGVEAGRVGIEFATGSLPAYLPDYEIAVLDAERMSPGYTIVEVIPFGGEQFEIAHAIALDDTGEIVWVYQYTGTVAGLEQTPNGNFVGHQYPFGLAEFDVLGNIVRRWHVAGTQEAIGGDDSTAFDADTLQGLEAQVAGFPGDPTPLTVSADWVTLMSFHHENFLMPDGNILTLSTTLHDLTPEQRQRFCPGDPEPFRITSDVVVEMTPGGQVVRTWDLWDAIDIDTTPGTDLCLDAGPYASELARDWTHANAVIYDQQRDAIMVSARHTNQVIALAHLDTEGPQSDLRWVLGTDGTIPLTGEPPFHQHALQLQDDGSVLLYDNGNGRPGTTVDSTTSPTYSRAVRYVIDDDASDPTQWTATQAWEYITDDAAPGTPDAPVYAYFVSDADRLANGNILIDNGGIELPFYRTRLIEVIPSDTSGGEIVFDMRLGSERYGVVSYRAARIASFYVGDAWVDEPG